MSSYKQVLFFDRYFYITDDLNVQAEIYKAEVALNREEKIYYEHSISLRHWASGHIVTSQYIVSDTNISTDMLKITKDMIQLFWHNASIYVAPCRSYTFDEGTCQIGLTLIKGAYYPFDVIRCLLDGMLFIQFGADENAAALVTKHVINSITDGDFTDYEKILQHTAIDVDSRLSTLFPTLLSEFTLSINTCKTCISITNKTLKPKQVDFY
jgi:hypothetical protein